MDHAYFINHQIADTLDSTDAFEGPEKLLEVEFSRRAPGRGLLALSRQTWQSKILDPVRCKILSMIEYADLHACVLSESSLFVYETNMVLKTCGTTTLLDGLPALFSLVADLLPDLEPNPVRVVYSRRSFLFPDRQMGPHRSWDGEVAMLRQHVGEGVSLVAGKNPNDRWHVYMKQLDSAQTTGPPVSTLQIMMTGLDEELAERFYAHRNVLAPKDDVKPVSLDALAPSASPHGAAPDDDDPGHHIGNCMTSLTGVDKIYEGSEQIIDSFAFAPCGYSCNGIVNGNRYFTIHVTPERGFSYASFETNVDAASVGTTDEAVISRVLEMLRPGSFSLVGQTSLPSDFPNYVCTEKTEGDALCHKLFRRN